MPIIISLSLLIALTGVISLVLKSILRRDSDTLDYLRRTYRERQQRARLGASYQAVSTNENVSSAALRREVYWKKLSGEVFRAPNFVVFYAALNGAGL